MTVLTSLYEPEKYHAFIWDEQNGMQDLNALANMPGWILTSATAINDHGDIVGTGLVNGQRHGFLLTTDQQPPPTPNQEPVAVASSDVSTGRAPLTVNFAATGSFDPEGAALTYEWDLGDGSITAEQSPSHTYTDPGIYAAVLTVTDNQGLTPMAQVEITVKKSGGRK